MHKYRTFIHDYVGGAFRLMYYLDSCFLFLCCNRKSRVYFFPSSSPVFRLNQPEKNVDICNTQNTVRNEYCNKKKLSMKKQNKEKKSIEVYSLNMCARICQMQEKRARVEHRNHIQRQIENLFFFHVWNTNAHNLVTSKFILSSTTLFFQQTLQFFHTNLDFFATFVFEMNCSSVDIVLYYINSIEVWIYQRHRQINDQSLWRQFLFIKSTNPNLLSFPKARNTEYNNRDNIHKITRGICLHWWGKNVFIALKFDTRGLICCYRSLARNQQVFILKEYFISTFCIFFFSCLTQLNLKLLSIYGNIN